MKSNKKILGGILAVVIMLFGLSFLVNQKVIFAEDSKVFYFDDLSRGDYIPYGSTIIVGQDYSTSYQNHAEGVYFFYYNIDNSDYEHDYSGINGKHIVNTYDFLFGAIDGNYSGWTIDRIFYNEIYLVPSTGGVVETSEPSESNDYTLELDGEIDEIKWYKYEDIGNFSSDSDNSLWTKDGDTWIFRNYEVSPYKFKTSVGYKEKVTFNLPVGDKVYLGIKYSICAGYDGTYCDSFKGTVDDNVIINNPSGRSYGSISYSSGIFGLEGADDHTLSFEYEQKYNYDSYFHLDAMTLTDLNQSGATLDTTDLQDGDKVFYIAKSGTQVFKGKLVVKKESETIKVNPATSNSILNYIILGIISISAIGLCIGYSKKFNI